MRLFKKFLRNKNFFSINKIIIFNCKLILAIIVKKKLFYYISM